MYSQDYSLAVVIPTHNRQDTLIQCLEHLENQTRRDFEVVVVDDGSTDCTADRLKSYAETTPLALRFVRQENGGPARARNRAISLVRAPICLMIGDDIFISSELVERHLKLHLERPERSAAALGLTVWSETGQSVTPFMRWLDAGGMQFNYGELLRGKTPDWQHFYTSNLSLKTDLLRQFPFDETFRHAAMEDMELACRIEARHGLDLVFIPGALAYHLHPTTFTQACRRMVRVGEAMAYFDRLWPGKRVSGRSQAMQNVKRLLQFFLLSNPWAVPTFVKIADRSTKWVCPNYFMIYVLGCHFTMGYRRYLHALTIQSDEFPNAN